MNITGYTLCDCPHGKLLEYQIVTGLNATFRPDDLPDCEKCGREGKIPNIQVQNTNDINVNECFTCGGGQPSCPVCHPTPEPDCMDCGKTPCGCKDTSLSVIAAKCHATSRSKGWWDDCKFLNPKADSTSGNGLDRHLVKKTIPEKLALIHSEVSEALEDYRDGKMLETGGYYQCGVCLGTGENSEAMPCSRCKGAGMVEAGGGRMIKPVGFPTELADIVIRVFDLAGALNIDLEEVILRKMAYNETRPYRHGGKTC